MGRTLTVYLAADVKKFKKGMDDAADSTHGLRGKIGGLRDTISNNLGPAMLGAAGLAGGLALMLGKDSVQAAIDDQAEVSKLTQLMDNLGKSQDVQPTLNQIDALQRLTGVSESELRPAFARLISSTGDVKGAFDLLKLGMDISAATGKDLSGVVVPALAKAYDGNTGALGRLGVGLDKATLKSGDMGKITDTLSDKFGGSATAAADTYKGKIDKLKVGFDELEESFGQGFLDALSGAESGLGDITTFMADNEQLVNDFGGIVGNTASEILEIAKMAGEAKQGVDDWLKSLGPAGKILADFGLTLSGGLIPIMNTAGDASKYLADELGKLLGLIKEAQGTYANNGSAEAAFHKPVTYTGGTPTNQAGYKGLDPITTSKTIAAITATGRARTGG